MDIRGIGYQPWAQYNSAEYKQAEISIKSWQTILLIEAYEVGDKLCQKTVPNIKKRGRKEGKDRKVGWDFQSCNFLKVSVALILYMSEG